MKKNNSMIYFEISLRIKKFWRLVMRNLKVKLLTTLFGLILIFPNLYAVEIKNWAEGCK